MKNFNFPRIALLLLLLVVFLSGCYRNRLVESYQVGLKLSDGVSISEVVGPGRYTDMGWWSDLVVVNASNVTTSWNDASLLTRDKQPIGMTMTLTFARKRDAEAIKKLYSDYNAEAKDDTALTNLVLSRVPGVAKEISTKYSLDQMLGIAEGEQALGREKLAKEVFDLLQTELAQVSVNLATVEIADIAVSDEYLAALNAKNKATIDQEVAKQQTILINEQLKQEQAQTQIELEKANRENQVNAVTAQAYEESPQLLQLKMLELTADMLDDSDVIIYVPEGSNVTNVLTQGGAVTPTN